MKIYLKKNVYEEALDRIRYLYDEFDVVIGATSGGKDSTVITELCVEVAKERGELPAKMLFVDQEAEYQGTVDYMRYMNKRPDIDLTWIQCPIRLFNATSQFNHWLNCWGKNEEWIRPREPDSIHENTFGTDRFKDFFDKYLQTVYPDKTVALLTGMRTDESPARYLATTVDATYKHITYGKVITKGQHYNFHPIYDWKLSDVWKYIENHNLTYNSVYDKMYQIGFAYRNMRVSNLHHETAIQNLFRLQEIEPETWEKCVQRLGGVNTAGHLGKDDYFNYELPPMFKNWKEYRDYLVENLLVDEESKKKFRKKFIRTDEKYEGYPKMETLMKTCVSAILANDEYFTKLNNYGKAFDVGKWLREAENKRVGIEDTKRRKK